MNKPSAAVIDGWKDFQKDIGRRPAEKIYLPCTYMKQLEDVPPLWGYPVWGFSYDAVRLSWLLFSRNLDPKWQMISTELNCSAVVWNRLVDSHMKALLEGKSGGGFDSLRKKIITIQPNDIMYIGEKLNQVVGNLNVRQEALNQLTKKNFAAVREIARRVQIDKPEQWYKMLIYDNWMTISRTRRKRSGKLRVIDKRMKDLHKTYHGITVKEERRLVRTILEDQVKYDKPWKEHERRLYRIELIGRSKDNEKDRTSKRKKIEEEIARARPALKKIQNRLDKNFKKLSKHRSPRIKTLIDVHNAIFEYLTSNPKKERLPRVLLLGHCISWAFYEAMYHGHYVNLAEPRDDNFYCLIAIDGPNLQNQIAKQTGVMDLLSNFSK